MLKLSLSTNCNTFLLLVACLSLSCTKQNKQQELIKLGSKVWTLQDVQSYFQIRLKSYSKQEALPKNIKKELISELLVKSLIENWAKKTNKKIKPVAIDKKNQAFFNKSQLQNLRDYTSYMSLYSLLLQELSKDIPVASINLQKKFYNKNKARFFKPARCHLKQIVVKQKNLALSLHKKLLQNSNKFNKLSKLYSIKPHPGWVEKGWLDVFDQACKHKIHSLSSVLKSLYGYHLFFISDKQDSKNPSFKQVQKQIIHILKNKQLKQKFQIWLNKSISETTLWINKKLLKQIRIQYKTNKI